MNFHDRAAAGHGFLQVGVECLWNNHARGHAAKPHACVSFVAAGKYSHAQRRIFFKRAGKVSGGWTRAFHNHGYGNTAATAAKNTSKENGDSQRENNHKESIGTVAH